MAKWVMVIDLQKCVGCGTCKEVCDQVNNVPPGSYWRRVVEVDVNPKEGHLYLTMSCMHCDIPPCLKVCPTKATYRRSDGIIGIEKGLCVGCAYCVIVCPYEARSIAVEKKMEPKMYVNAPMSESGEIGVSTKCNFCLPRIDSGLSRGLKPGQDPEATPLCVRFCISGALFFGDLDDPESQVSKLMRENRTTRILEELGTDPKVYYISK